ncbi:40368_t:CDS:2 [Gigaspora margarita]|uniref:40368_t:CDS:1 n=1 Tax=Gigaspora margarita TaxID=4874 RepID=A0ABN7VJN6_GIGMA|nr:40368_t:CDS:2 [Gigaspora margarita]
MLLGEAASINLELLPDSPDLILEHITEFFPFALPISDRKQTRTVVAALRKIFSFTQLSSSYFYDNKEPLPLDPSDLIDTFKGQFPITDYDSLSCLSELKANTTTKLDLLPKLEELTSYVKDNIPDIAAQVSITDYNIASQTIRAIQDHFNFTLIPNYLIDLPDLPMPE